MRTLPIGRMRPTYLIALCGLICASSTGAQEVRPAQLQRLTVASTNTILLHLEGVQGASQVVGHEGWIDASGWGFGIDADIASATGMLRGRPTVRQLVVIKRVDIATPKLFDLCAKAAVVPAGELKVPIPDGVLRIEFNQARVVSLGHDPDTAPDAATERLALMAVEYKITVETSSGNYEATWRSGVE